MSHSGIFFQKAAGMLICDENVSFLLTVSRDSIYEFYFHCYNYLGKKKFSVLFITKKFKLKKKWEQIVTWNVNNCKFNKKMKIFFFFCKFYFIFFPSWLFGTIYQNTKCTVKIKYVLIKIIMPNVYIRIITILLSVTRQLYYAIGRASPRPKKISNHSTCLYLINLFI